MIVIVDKTFLTRSEEEKEQDVCDIISILEHGHYIEMNPLVKAAVTEIVENSLSKPQKALYQEATEYLSPTRTMKRYLQTLKFYDFTLEQRKLLFLTSSELLIENAPNEWPIYNRMSVVYKNDRYYFSVFSYVERAINETKMLKGVHCGGKGEIPKMISYKNQYEFDGLYNHKVCILFDRDTDNDACFATDNNPIFRFLCNKDAAQVVESDIYKLDFGNGYVWHSWYKRAIENYFPKIEYTKLGVDMTDYPDDDSYDYVKFPIEETKQWQKNHHKAKKDKQRKNYQKNMMENIGISMTMKDYEKNLKLFDIQGIQLSELQLFLLKLAEIV